MSRRGRVCGVARYAGSASASGTNAFREIGRTPVENLALAEPSKSEMVLRDFVGALGFDAEKVIEQLTSDQFDTCKRLSLGGLRVVRDFSETTFSPVGVNEANKWLDRLQK